MCTVKRVLKADTREDRECYVFVKDSPPIYSDFMKFLRRSNSKIELFSVIADKVPKFTKNISTTVICTKLSEVTPNSKNDLSLFFRPTTKKQTVFDHPNR